MVSSQSLSVMDSSTMKVREHTKFEKMEMLHCPSTAIDTNLIRRLHVQPVVAAFVHCARTSPLSMRSVAVFFSAGDFRIAAWEGQDKQHQFTIEAMS